MAGITQVPVGENHVFSIETEVAVNVVLLRKINPMNRVRKPLRAAAFPEKEDTLGLSPDSEKGIRGKCRERGGMLCRIMERSSLISSMWPESCSFSSWYSYSAAQASMNSSERDVAEPLVTI